MRAPFGASPVPEIFQAKIHSALTGLRGVGCIADDILIVGTGDTEAAAVADHHNRNLRALLDRCREKGIKLNKQKLKLNRDVTTFCGHELTRSSVRPDSRKVEAITKMPASTDKKGVMRLLGMVTYLARFCPNLS